MTEITKKALALINQVEADRGFALSRYNSKSDIAEEALCRAIEQHEAYKQDVSDALEEWFWPGRPPRFERFMLPKPKPDPLVEVLDKLNVGNGWDDTEDYARRVYKALAKRGLKIVEDV